MAVFYNSVGAGDSFYQPVLNFSIIPLSWQHTASGSEIAVVTALSFWVYNSNITGIWPLVRSVTYGGKTMTSLGIQQHGTTNTWTEFFGLINAPAGKQTVSAQVTGGLSLVGRVGRANSVAYTGASGFGAFTGAGSGTGSSMTVSAAAPAAGVLVGGFSALDSSAAAFTRNTRYLNNSHMSLVMGEVDGNGSSLSIAATRGSSGPWGGGAVIINPADIAATGLPVSTDPGFYAEGRRYPRSPGFVRRTVFNAQPEN